jgi:hypothetical protein
MFTMKPLLRFLFKETKILTNVIVCFIKIVYYCYDYRYFTCWIKTIFGHVVDGVQSSNPYTRPTSSQIPLGILGELALSVFFISITYMKQIECW